MDIIEPQNKHWLPDKNGCHNFDKNRGLQPRPTSKIVSAEQIAGKQIFTIDYKRLSLHEENNRGPDGPAPNQK